MKQCLCCWYNINSFIEAFVSSVSSIGTCILRPVQYALLHPFTDKQNNKHSFRKCILCLSSRRVNVPHG